MTEAMWIALLGVLGTLLSGLGTNFLSNRARDKERSDQRYRMVQDSARSAILEVIVAWRKWLVLISPFAQIMASKEIDEITQAVQEMPNGDEIRTARDVSLRASTNAKLLVADEAIRAQLDALSTLSRSWAVDVLMTPDGMPRFGSAELDASRAKEWKAKEAAFSANLDHLEKLAAVATAVPIKR